MRVKYKETLNPLYKFEEKDIRIHDTAPGAKIIIRNGKLLEIHEAQGKSHNICNVLNVIEITEE